MFDVIIKKSIIKNIVKMPKGIQFILESLLDDLKHKGPFRFEWPNYSKLGKNKYHCHLSHQWVACWTYEINSVIIEVYYAGSRENAPY
jgi:mRNA-degrading endonuclease RelE of RelBE toxin-antitoxin system